MRNTIIDYYLGGHGPTIYIGVKSMEWLVHLKNSISQLNDGVVSCVNFNRFENIEISGIKTFELVKVAQSPSIMLHGDGKDGANIVWSQDSEGLKNILGLIDILIEKDMQSHQYLAEDGVLLIELSYKE